MIAYLKGKVEFHYTLQNIIAQYNMVNTYFKNQMSNMMKNRTTIIKTISKFTYN